MSASSALRNDAPAQSGAPDLDVWVGIETPEQIAFSYSVAGIGSRGAAALIDAAICVGTLILVFIVMSVAASYLPTPTARDLSSGTWVIAIYVLLQFAMIWGYYVLFEGLWDGQTPGKRMMQLRVVSDGGFSVSFGASAVRNIIRALDAMPIPLYIVGIIAALLNSSRKRLGDMAAGTIVIKETRTELRARASSQQQSRQSVLTARLSDDEYALLERYVTRRNSIDAARRDVIIAQLGKRFATQLATYHTTPAAGLIRLYDDERDARASGVASRTDTGARREQHAIVALGLKRWNDFADALDRARSRGLRHMTPEQISGLVAEYREITTDMARLQTATRGRSSDALFYVSRLVARGHNLLYRQRAQTLRAATRYIAVTVPSEVRRSWRQIGLAALLTFGPAAISYFSVVRHPTVAQTLLPDEMLSRANTGSAREKRGEGYVTIEDEMRPIAASSIISNNVQVTYVAFALGLTAGIGTMLLLVLNGVSIGAAVGLFASKGIAHLILAFVAPHGVLELSAICIAGGGGFLIAQGMLLPGDLTRREALVANGKRAITLIAASTLLLLVAGTIEGLVSPRVWPMAWKASVSAVTALALICYLALGRERTKVRAPIAA